MNTGSYSAEYEELTIPMGLEQAPVAIAIVSGKDHTVQLANQKQLELWQRSAEEVIHRSLFQIFPEAREQGFGKLLDCVYESGNVIRMQDHETRLSRNGMVETAWFDFTYSPLRNQPGEICGIMVVSVEVTEKVKARKALEDSQYKYRTLFNEMQQGFCIIDMIFRDDKPVDYLFLDANAIFSSHTGLQDPVGKTARQLVPDLEQKWFDLYGTAARQGIPVSFIEESAAMGKWFEVFAYRLGGEGSTTVAIIFKDITAAREAEIALKQSEEKARRQLEELESIYHTAPVGLGLIDREYRFVRINQKLAEINGLSPEEHIGKSIFDILPDLSQTVAQHFEVIFETGLPMLGVEVTGETKALPDVVRTWNESWYPIKDEAGSTVAISVVVEEITQVKEVQQRIRESELRFRTLAENLPDIVSRHDTQFRYVYANPAIEQYIGKKPEELVGYNFRELGFPDAVCDFFETQLRQVFTGKRLTLLEFRNPFGPQYLFARLVPEFDEEGELKTVLIVNTDITKLHEAEEALKESESRFRELANDTPAFMFTADGDTNIEFVNRRWLEFVGLDENEGLGRAWARVTHPDDVAPMMEIYSRAVQDKTPYQFQIRQQDTSGEYRWIIWNGIPRMDAEGNFKGMIGIGLDVTEQKKAQEIIRENEVRFRTIADLIPQMVWTATPEGVTDYYNYRWTEFKGPDTTEHSFHLEPYVHPEESGLLKTVWQYSLRSGEPLQVELRLWDRSANDYRWTQTRAVPLRDQQGRIIRWFGTTTDMHDQKTVQEKLEQLVQFRTGELARSNAELQRSNEDLQQFAHVASHDLKEPIRKISTFLLRLKDELSGSCTSRATGYLDRMDVAAKRMSSMIDGVLLYSSINGAGVERERVDLEPLFGNIRSDLELPITNKAVNLQTDCPHAVEGSSILLYQLFYNLLSNALKFTRDGVVPEIRVRAVELTQAESDRAGLNSESSWVRIEVQDNGIGFPQEQADRIFQTFTRLHSKDAFEGTGLGLSLCKKIVERHGGLIEAKGQEGQGSLFTVFLPAHTRGN